MSFDYSGTDVATSETDMQRLTRLVHIQKEREAEAEQKEAELGRAKALLKDVCEVELPELMRSLGMNSLETEDGIRVALLEKIRASIPKAKQDEAFAWLDEHGNSHLIKRQFIIDFGKGEDGWADKFERDCKQRKKELHLTRKKSVHSSTLTAFVKQELKENGTFPELFGVFRQKLTKIDTK